MREFLEQAVRIWIAGQWAMIPLAINSFLLFWIGFRMWFSLHNRSLGGVSEPTWRRWIVHPAERQGPAGEAIDFLMEARDLPDLSVRFSEFQTTETASFQRDLRLMRRAVSTAPLFGLLGTVTGMLATFQALATGSGGQKTMDMVAGGISEALITTETGLVIALPGLFFLYHLQRRKDRYEATLARLETVCAQQVFRRTRREPEAALEGADE